MTDRHGRENSGMGRNDDHAKDPTLRDNAGKGVPGTNGDFSEGASFEVGADHDLVGGKRSPSARGRGEVDSDTEVDVDEDLKD